MELVAPEIIDPLEYHWYVVFDITGVVSVIALEPQTKIDPEGEIVGVGAGKKSI